MHLHPDYYRRSYGSDALRALVRWMLGPGGHHHVVIEPAADNVLTVACYQKVDFQRGEVFCNSLLLCPRAEDLMRPQVSPA